MFLGSAFLVSLLILAANASISDYISPLDRIRFLSVLTRPLASTTNGDLTSPYYAAQGYVLLKEKLPLILRLNGCSYLAKEFTEDVAKKASPEVIFHVLGAAKILECTAVNQTSKLFDVQLHPSLQTALDSDTASVADLRYALDVVKLGKSNLKVNEKKVASTLQSQLKNDDSLLNIGHALHAARNLGSAGAFVNQYIEDVVAQADEVDAKFLQWEGGITITGLLLSGVLQADVKQPVTQVQADKFANYLLSRKTTTTLKGICALIDSVQVLSLKSFSPVCITFATHSGQVTPDQPDLKLRISNILGEPVKPALTSVIAQSATRVVDDVVVLSKQSLTATSDPTIFTLPLRLEPGHYRLGISAGTHSAALTVRVLGPITLKQFEVGLADSDGTTAPRLNKLDFPSKLPSTIQADSSHHLIVRFALSRPVHQAFLRLSSGNSEIIFVAEQDSTKLYKIDVDLDSELKHSSTFQLELIIGDSIVSNPLRWSFGEIEVKLGAEKAAAAKGAKTRGPLPEIKHMFRPAEKRPPQAISMLFTALVASPLLLLLVLWIKLGVNLRNFTITAIPFHGGLAGIFGLFTLFWLKLNMFTTCAWLVPLGSFTFLAGHRILSKLAKQKKVQ